MADAAGAIERLYEDSDLRDELQDAEATQFLKWAEEQITRLAAETPDRAAARLAEHILSAP